MMVIMVMTMTTVKTMMMVKTMMTTMTVKKMMTTMTMMTVKTMMTTMVIRSFWKLGAFTLQAMNRCTIALLECFIYTSVFHASIANRHKQLNDTQCATFGVSQQENGFSQ